MNSSDLSQFFGKWLPPTPASAVNTGVGAAMEAEAEAVVVADASD